MNGYSRFWLIVFAALLVFTSADGAPLLKQSTAHTIRFGPFVDDTDGKTAETGLTISQADIRISKAGAAFAQTNDATGATHDENGWYSVPLDTTDTNTLGELIVAVHKSGALPVWMVFQVVPANVYDSWVSGSDYLQTDAVQVEGGDAKNAIKAEVDTALSDYDAPTNAEMEARTLVAAAYFDPATDKVYLGNGAHGGAAATLTLSDYSNFQSSGFSTHSAADVWAVAARKLTHFEEDDMTIDLDSTTIGTVNTLTGHTAQTGDSFVRLGAPAGASVSADIATVDGVVDAIKAKTDNLPADPADDSDIDEQLSTITTHLTDIKGTGFAKDTHSLPQCLTATGFSTHAAADIWSVVTRTLTALDEDDTTIDLKGTAIGSVVGNVGGNVTGSVGSLAAQAKADVNAEVDTAFSDYDPPTKAEMDAGFAGLNDPTAAAVSAAVWGEAVPGAYGAGTAGNVLGNNLDAAISSRAPSATALSNVQWTDARAAKLDNLDGTITSRAPSATALSNATWTNTLATYLARLGTTMEADGGVYRFTQNSLEQAPTGGGGDATLANQTAMTTLIEKVITMLEAR